MYAQILRKRKGDDKKKIIYNNNIWRRRHWEIIGRSWEEAVADKLNGVYIVYFFWSTSTSIMVYKLTSMLLLVGVFISGL